MAARCGPSGAAPAGRVIIRRCSAWGAEVSGGALMRKIWFLGLLLVLSGALAYSSHAGSTSVAGDYVEVRTASVFAGACHYNGEVVTTGRDAVMAWQFKRGQWQGTDLAGVRAL